MRWRERKGEQKWVSVPQAEVKVTVFLASPPQLSWVDEVIPLVPQRA